MSHSFSQNYVHLVFGTKDRRNSIPTETKAPLWAYLAGVCKSYELAPVAIGGTENHVHLLFQLSPKVSLAKAVQVLKANSSRWMGEQGIRFAWQAGYGAFSVSASNLDQVAGYIRGQEAHHRKFSFEDEFRTFLKKHSIDHDPDDIFD